MKTYEVFTESYSTIIQAMNIHNAIYKHYASDRTPIIAIVLADRPDLLKNISECCLRETIENFTIVNPILISDGGGEFPDSYKMKESDIDELIDLLKKIER